MKITNVKDIRLEKAVHGPYMKQVFIRDGDVSNLSVFGRVTIKSGQIAANHGHEGKSEVYLVEKGKAKIKFNKSEEKEVGEGDIVITNSDETHEVSNPFEEDLVLLFIEVKN